MIAQRFQGNTKRWYFSLSHTKRKVHSKEKLKLINSLRTYLLILICLFLFESCCPEQEINDLQKAYFDAICDAKIAESEEICRQLTAIVEHNKDLIWKGIRGNRKVLVVYWTDWEGYAAEVRKTITAERDIWVTVVPELRKFIRKHSGKFENLSLRLEQLLGLPPNCEKIIFVEVWVDPDDLFRPSPDPEISDREAELDFPCSENYVRVNEAYKEWFNCKKRDSYKSNGYPWTRLGSTYDWGNPDCEVGLSEFVIKKDSKAEVHSVIPTHRYGK
jgi:hypothetical protein